MTTSVSQMITNIGYAVDDPNNKRFTTTQLLTYINEAQKDITRRAEVIQAIEVIPVLNNQRDYIAPFDCTRIYKVEFYQTGGIQIWPLQYRGIIEMDALWGINQFNTSAWPQVYTSWQQPPNILLRLYPVPGQAGAMNVYYYRFARDVLLTDNLDLPLGWEDLVRDYCTFLCKQADADPTWTDFKKIYEDKLLEYINKSRKNVEAAGNISTGFDPSQGYNWGGWDF